MRIVAILNQKGGVGKTTTAVNLGSILANEYSKKVLLVDIDPQGNLSDHVGLDPFSTEKSIYDLIIRCEPPEGLIRHCFGMDVLPANLDLAGAEVELASMTVRETRLRNALRGFCHNYDVTLIDCPPSLGLLTLSALTLATEVIVPMQAEYLAMRGLGQLMHTIELVKENLNSKIEISGIIFCQFNSQTRLSQEVSDEVESHFPKRVYKNRIRKNVRLAESPSHCKPAPFYDADCSGVQDYRGVAAEFLRRGGEETALPQIEKTSVIGDASPVTANLSSGE